jgi:hypothetical protein
MSSIIAYFSQKVYDNFMGLFVTDSGKRSELQERLTAELREKAARQSDLVAAEAPETPDGVEDSEYIKGYKKTTGLAWAWVAILVGVVVAVIVAIIMLT